MGDDLGRRSFRNPRQMGLYAALLFGTAGLVGALGLVFPHQEELDEQALTILAAACGVVAVVLVLGAGRFPRWGFGPLVALGTVLVSLSLVFNGERNGGAAGGDEIYYLWVVLYAAYFFRRRGLVVQVVLIAIAYAGSLWVIDPGPVASSRWLTTIGLVVGTAVIVRILSERNEQLVEDLDRTARTDRLTGLANRLAFEERFADELARSGRSGRPLALLLADVDRLKEINDRGGHSAGDAALAQVGRTLRRELRAVDTPARVGGDEFAILLPELDRQAAEAVSLRLAGQVGEHSREHGPPVGLAFGLACFPEDGRSSEALLRVADQALYAAKPARPRHPAPEALALGDSVA
ncbi:MAG TPA: GGDEF domain-containing protein [Thermoleophilaceae bacterium]|nr:GGDEF domain-containing protein [Thermoleophilaceae bacterium]